jgi:hypothetical protein
MIWGRAIKGSTSIVKKEIAGKTRAAVTVPISLPNNERAAIGIRVLASCPITTNAAIPMLNVLR